MVGKMLGAWGAMAIVAVVVNVALLAGAIWVVVTMLRWLDVI